ncbi:succinate dehydrogenase / fumarate reductase, cytochrome b subunit [biofilm metagenome]
MTNKHPRPTSPHLQIYRLPLTGLISITHRITGVLLSAGLILIVAFLYVIAQGEVAYQGLQVITGYGLVKLIYWGFVFALYFHVCHGVRHLLWDVGAGFEAGHLNKFAKLEVLFATGLTFITSLIL